MTDVASAQPLAARAEIAAVADNVVALVRTFNKVRAQMLAAAAHDVEWSARLLLKTVANEGPIRASAVAECLHSDPSTISRQVAALVREGLLERRSDPADGRASLLAITSMGALVIAEDDQLRLAYFAQMLEGWSDADLHRFAELLSRFTTAYEAANGNWIRERANRAARVGSET